LFVRAAIEAQRWFEREPNLRISMAGFLNVLSWHVQAFSELVQIQRFFHASHISLKFRGRANSTNLFVCLFIIVKNNPKSYENPSRNNSTCHVRHPFRFACQSVDWFFDPAEQVNQYSKSE
jgi:hypothetical protein